MTPGPPGFYRFNRKNKLPAGGEVTVMFWLVPLTKTMGYPVF